MKELYLLLRLYANLKTHKLSYMMVLGVKYLVYSFISFHRLCLPIRMEQTRFSDSLGWLNRLD